MGRKLISVLIPTYRSGAFVRRALHSALTQSERDVEVIVVDNASDDDTSRIVAGFAERDPRVRFYRNDANVGPVRNWRRCAELARGEFAGLLFSDDWYEGEFLSEAARFLTSPEIGFVYSPVNLFVDRSSGLIFERTCYHLDPPVVRPSGEFLSLMYENPGALVPVSPGCALFRRRDLVDWLGRELPDPLKLGFERHGAGPDVSVYLQACERYGFFAHLLSPLVNFLWHGTNLTREGETSLSYRVVLDQHLLRSGLRAVDAHLFRARSWWAVRQDKRRRIIQRHMGLRAWLSVLGIATMACVRRLGGGSARPRRAKPGP